MKGTLSTVLGTVLCVGAIAAWAYVAPAAGAGWILFAAFIGCLGLLNSINKPALHTVAGAVITVAAGAAWYANSALPHAGWLLFLAILGALRTFTSLNSTVSNDTK